PAHPLLQRGAVLVADTDIHDAVVHDEGVQDACVGEGSEPTTDPAVHAMVVDPNACRQEAEPLQSADPTRLSCRLGYVLHGSALLQLATRASASAGGGVRSASRPRRCFRATDATVRVAR